MDQDNINPNQLAWYASTQGPGISSTLKALAGLLIPTLHDFFHITVVSSTIDPLIDALLIIAFGLYALYGHLRAKQSLGHTITKLQGALYRAAGTKKPEDGEC